MIMRLRSSQVMNAYLFLEVPNGIVIGIRQEVVNILICVLDMLLEMIHQMPSIPFDLVCTRHRTEHNLDEPAVREWSISDPSHNFVPMLDHRKTNRVSIKHQARDVLSRHLWKLALKETFEAREDDHGSRFSVVPYCLELYISGAVFCYDDLFFGWKLRVVKEEGVGVGHRVRSFRHHGGGMRNMAQTSIEARVTSAVTLAADPASDSLSSRSSSCLIVVGACVIPLVRPLSFVVVVAAAAAWRFFPARAFARRPVIIGGALCPPGAFFDAVPVLAACRMSSSSSASSSLGEVGDRCLFRIGERLGGASLSPEDEEALERFCVDGDGAGDGAIFHVQSSVANSSMSNIPAEPPSPSSSSESS